MTFTPLKVLSMALLLGSITTGCAAEPEPTQETDLSEDELSLMDPSALRDLLRQKLETISAAREATFVSTSHDALANLDRQLVAAKVTDLAGVKFVLRVKDVPLKAGIPFDHSEVDVAEALDGGRRIPMRGRLLGDFWGAGFYDDRVSGHDVGAPLCVDRKELRAAVEAAYVPGHYLVTFVCHNITFRVLDALGVPNRDYAKEIRAWKLASVAFGPLFTNVPAASARESKAGRACGALGVR